VPTKETLTSLDDPRILAAGDCAAPSDRPFRMSCQAAGPLGAHAAGTVLRRLAGQTPDETVSDHRTDEATGAFVAHRNLLFTVAYEMLGSAADAEDVLQQTWLRWIEVDRARGRDQRAYLVRITTRQALNRS
jgi:NADH dehydrogenase FAD-containing subunit